MNRAIPVIRDEYVDIEFGTGALKVTPAHDVNDYMLGEKYNLEVIDIFNDDGTINDKVGLYVGHGSFRRPQEDRRRPGGSRPAGEDRGLYQQRGLFGAHGRGHRAEALDAVVPLDGDSWPNRRRRPSWRTRSASCPTKYKNTYRHWMENIKDWCISRQLWWGQRIPAWYLPQGGFVVAPTAEEALEKARAKTGDASLQPSDLRQDDDVLDTWFSSWLWPISVFDGIRNPGNREISYYYPTNDLVTGPDIIFFWVARMIMAGYEYRGEKPFGNVYFTGIVRDKIGRKMSKQLGNSPDPLDLIAKYGADGMRMAMLHLLVGRQRRDVRRGALRTGTQLRQQDMERLPPGERLVGGRQCRTGREQPSGGRMVPPDARPSLCARSPSDFGCYRISEAFKTTYKLFWDDFSGLYLEMVKPAYGQPIDAPTFEATRTFFDSLMRVLHPFMPFVTEEIWQDLAPRKEGESITVAPMPQPDEIDGQLLARFELAREVISSVRNVRNQKNLPQKEALTLKVIADENYPAEYAPVMRKMANLTAIETVTEKDPAAAAFIVKTTQYFVPMAGKIDAEAERRKLTDELSYQEGFLASVMKKLSNERFVQSAPEKVVANERAKQADAEAKIAAIKAQLEALS